MASYQEMLLKLKQLYMKEEHLKKVIFVSMNDLEQVKEDIEMLQNSIMYYYNKRARKKEVNNNGK